MGALAVESQVSDWLTVKEAAARVKVGVDLIYTNIKLGRLRAARLGARNELRIHVDWLDAWMERCATTVHVVNDDAPAQPIVPFRKRGARR